MSTAKAASLVAAARDLLEAGSWKEGSVNEALAKATDALQLYETSGDQEGTLEALGQVIAAKAAQWKADEALEMAVAKAAAFRRAGDKGGEAAMLLATADVYVVLQDPRNALESATRALALRVKSSDTKGELAALLKTVDIRLLMGDTRRALQDANQASAVAKKVQDDRARAGALYTLARVRHAADSGDASAAALEALALYRKAQDTRGTAAALHVAAQAHLSRSRYEDAVKSAGESLELFRELGDTAGMLNALDKLINAYLLSEDAQMALQTAEQEFSKFKEAEDEWGVAGMSRLLFDALRRQKDRDQSVNEALRVAEAGLNDFMALGDASGEADMWYRVADVHLSSGMMEETMQEAQKALMLYRDLDDQVGVENASLLLTEVYCRRGRCELAPHRPEALELVRRMASAIDVRDGTGFHAAALRLNAIAVSAPLVTQEEQYNILGPIIARDPEGVEAFIQDNSPEASGRGGTQAAARTKPHKFFTAPSKESIYAGFLSGGISYGPRFRCVDSMQRVSGLPDDATLDDHAGFGVLDIQDCAQDWEFNVRNPPFILDCGLQSTSVLGDLLSAKEMTAKDREKAKKAK